MPRCHETSTYSLPMFDESDSFTNDLLKYFNSIPPNINDKQDDITSEESDCSSLITNRHQDELASMISTLETSATLYDVGRERDMNKISVVLCIFKGKTAHNINGQTIYSLFRLPINQDDIQDLSSDISNSMSVELGEMQVVILDEISMVSSRHLIMIDKLLRNEKDFVTSTEMIPVAEEEPNRDLISKGINALASIVTMLCGAETIDGDINRNYIKITSKSN
ncbi:hypothetical protein INT48_006397 [Thamnidium elegans]|uniref:ATP-dependent DNA helicase n=1 Tax=Thamnidium elegans TaxID=101142 RepID=A0A8H7SN23_9FUNG|nr:hypothetical protein INT48_006397 [Thamnidium elegans]